MIKAKQLSILEHFTELRRCLLKSVIAIITTTVISFVFINQIFAIILWHAHGMNLVFIEVTEMIGTYMKVSLVSGMIFAMPYLVYQFIWFITPGLTVKEKKYIYFAIPWISLMFIGGVLFGYFVLIPPAVQFLLGFGTNIAEPQIRIGNYVSLVARLLLGVGIVFEIPVVTTFLSFLGICTPKWLMNKRKFSIIFAFIFSAVITPTYDPINQCIVAIPMIILYELSIILSKIVEKNRQKKFASLSVAG